MKYPGPRAILTQLSTRGPSAVQAEAIDLLLIDLPERWPNFERGSREALLRRLAANRKKSAKTRLEAVRELLRLLKVETKPKAQEIDDELRALLTGQPQPSGKTDSVDTRDSNRVPAAPTPQPVPSPSASTSESEATQHGQKVKADVEKADEAVPVWFPPLHDPNADAAALLSAKLARLRHAESFNVAQWAALSLDLARQRDKEPKRRRYFAMPTAGDELND